MTISNGNSDEHGEAEKENLQRSDAIARPVGRFHTWWRGDALPSLPRLSMLSIEPTDDENLIGGLAGIDNREVRERMRRGHQPWLARSAGEPVAWGWCAAAGVSIGELGISRSLPPGNRYLWDFVTVPPWRGRRIYPRLLQAIVAHELEAERFWVGHDLDNSASARGIARAGFQEVGLLFLRAVGGFELVPREPLYRAAAASALFGVPIVGRNAADLTAGRRVSSDHARAQAVR